ncbi:hypothetical protein [Alistipes putredinis]|uniref:hypothetical protein n=1 Tax=Alistipes putredinis TaxID=28117 RepID=UPI003FD8A977
MNSILTATVTVHANYIRTSVRKYYTLLKYVEYGFGRADIPRIVMECDNVEGINDLIRNVFSSGVESPDECLPGFKGWFTVCVEFPNGDDMNEFDVREFRIVHERRGGRDLVNAFANPTFRALRRKVLTNLFTALSERDADKVDQVLKALESASGAKLNV